MQKLFNLMAVSAFTVAVAQVTILGYLYANQDKYIEQVRSQIMEEVSGMIPGLGSDAPTGDFNVNPYF